MGDFFTSSDLTKAYGGVIEYSPEETACRKELASKLKPLYDKRIALGYHPSLVAQKLAYASLEPSEKAREIMKITAQINSMIKACVDKKKGVMTKNPCGPFSHLEEGDMCISDLPEITIDNLIKPPYIYIIGAVGVLVVGLLIGRAIK